MSGKSEVPDAWDDDWESMADKREISPRNETPEPPVRLSKAARKAQHVESNKQLWDAAESPERPIFLQARNSTPLTSDFKPAMKVLSRKPPPGKVGDPSRALGDLRIADEDDSEEEERRRNAASLVERQAKAQKEREEKQRKYLEVRERLFGSPAGSEEPQSRSSSKNGQQSTSRNSSRGKGRGRSDIDSHVSSADQSPARGSNQKRQLYDPNYTPKPQSMHVQRASGSSRPGTPAEEQPVRQPRGPDGSGRGGFGFGARGHRIGS